MLILKSDWYRFCCLKHSTHKAEEFLNKDCLRSIWPNNLLFRDYLPWYFQPFLCINTLNTCLRPCILSFDTWPWPVSMLWYTTAIEIFYISRIPREKIQIPESIQTGLKISWSARKIFLIDPVFICRRKLCARSHQSHRMANGKQVLEKRKSFRFFPCPINTTVVSIIKS